MSIIKCPECGHQVSSMAGTCPGCGVEISSRIKECKQCGRYSFDSGSICPACGYDETEEESTPASSEQPNPTPETEKPAPKRKNRHILPKVLFFLLLCGLAVGGYYYWEKETKRRAETEDFLKLEKVTNPEFYKQYIAEHPESPYCAEVKKRLETLTQESADWANLLKTRERQALERFMQAYPHSARVRICLDMIDSIDWAETLKQDTPEALKAYLENHTNGKYVNDATERIMQMNKLQVPAEMRAQLVADLETFFRNAAVERDKKLTADCLAKKMEEFNGKASPSVQQIMQYTKKEMPAKGEYKVSEVLMVRRSKLSDSTMGYEMDCRLEQQITGEDTGMQVERTYRMSVLLNDERKIVRLNIN